MRSAVRELVPRFYSLLNAVIASSAAFGPGADRIRPPAGTLAGDGSPTAPAWALQVRSPLRLRTCEQARGTRPERRAKDGAPATRRRSLD